MGTRTRNGYLANMAKQIEAAIINCGNPFVEVYLDSMDCSIEAELSNLRWLQKEIAAIPDKEPYLSFDVIKKWLFGWKQADQCLACMGLKDSAEWADGYYKAGQA